MKIDAFEVTDYNGGILEVIQTISESYLRTRVGYSTVYIETDKEGKLVIKIS